MPSLLAASVWLFVKRDYLLEYFYFSQLLAITHLVTLGFLSSLMMGVVYRLGPTLLGAPYRSRRLARVQFGLFFVGVWGMVAHFWLDEPRGMSWSTFLVWSAALAQVWNFRSLFVVGGKNRWPARFVAASLVYFFVAATLGVLLGLVKGYGLAVSFLSPHFIDNVFAHAHLAGVGWVTMMVFGVQLKLVPTTIGSQQSIPIRFALMQVGTLGLAATLLLEGDPFPFALMLAIAIAWQTVGPLRALLTGRAKEWEVMPLLFLVAASVLGVALSLGHPGAADPMKGRVQLAYGVLSIWGFMVATVATVAFKLFPMWVWKERFQDEFGKKPVPGMKELHSETLRVATNASLGAGVVATVIGIVSSNAPLLLPAVGLIVAGVVCFLINFARVARWGLTRRPYDPTPSDLAKFERMFPTTGSGRR